MTYVGDNREEWRNIPDFPDHTGYAVREDRMQERYGKERYKLLVDTEEYKNLPEKLADIPTALRCFIPQDDKRWLDMREDPQLTGSVSAELAGLHDNTAASLLGLPKMMWHNPSNHPFNEKWDDLINRVKYGKLPRTPMDPPGNVHCAQGKVKEANALAYLMDMIPTMEFEEVGAVEITEKQLMHFDLRNPFKGDERISKFPKGMKIVISADGRAKIPKSCKDHGNGSWGFSMEKMSVALELKYPTFFREKNNSDFAGFDFYPLGSTLKLYEHPKEYYVPQTFLEMLALMQQTAVFGCASYGKGMRVWLIHMDTKYLSALLGLYIHIFEKFVVKGLRVPTDYIFEKYTVESNTRKTYRWLIDRTLEIANKAPLYMFIPPEDTMRITQEIGTISNNTYVRFPALPEDVVPKYQLLCIYGRRLLYYFEKIHWVSAYTQFDMRQDNIKTLAETEHTIFAFDVLADIHKNLTNRYTEKYEDEKTAAEVLKLHVVRNKIMESLEYFLLAVYKMVFRLYGNPPFGGEHKLDAVVYHNNIVKAALELSEKYEVEVLSDERVFGTEWMNTIMEKASWTKKYDVTSEERYKMTLVMMKPTEIENGNTENMEWPENWQYMRLLAILMFLE